MPENNIDQLKYSDIVEHVDTLEMKIGKWTAVNIAFLSNITIDPLIPCLKYLCYQEGIKADVYIGPYDNIMQDAINKNSGTYKHSPDIVVICLKMNLLSEKLVYNFASMGIEDVKAELDRVMSFIDMALGSIRKNSKALILLHNFEMPVYPAYGVLDYRDYNKQVNTFRRTNMELVNLAKKYESVYIVDVDLLQSTTGYMNFFDNRYWHLGKTPYTIEACKMIAKEYMKFIRALKGRNKKCLVLDCDNTLWGGIIGEDGISKIELGLTYPGSAYREFQQSILNLYHRGILLAICSKNNEKDVIEVMEKHPDMVLRKGHFVSMKVNWSDKVSNLREIAANLNIGINSLVFVDDNDFEISMVNKMLPEITTIKLPKDPSKYRDLLDSSGVFDTLSISEEDRKRSEMYRAEIERNKAKTRFEAASMEDYYRYLEMEIIIKSADNFSIPRISQLTQRTNQFNLTTKRYSEADIKAMADSQKHDVLYLQLNDRFGEYGVVGVAIVEYSADKALIDSFLLSCRVIGRTVEDVLLKTCINLTEKRGCREIVGLYIPTSKNAQVEQFYKDHQFTFSGKNNDEFIYSLFLKESLPGFPDYFKSIEVEI